MRKATTLSAVMAATALTFGAPAVVYAADAPTSVPGTAATKPSQLLRIALEQPTAKPGAPVRVDISGPALKDTVLRSPVLTDTRVEGDHATGTVREDAAPGPVQVTVSGTTADGRQLSASVPLSVVGTPTPPASPGTLSLNPGKAAAGSTVDMELKLDKATVPASVTAGSDAFVGDSVQLTKGRGNVWTGKAVIARVEAGPHRVSAFGRPDTPPLATTGVTVVASTPAAPVTPVKPMKPVTPPTAPMKPVTPATQPMKPVAPASPGTPTAPQRHVIPKGSVDTGMAPVPVSRSSAPADEVAGGVAAAGGAALLGYKLLARSRGNGA